MSPQAASGLGEALARAREACGVTVEQLSTATRIRAEVVRALEAGDLSSCGGPAYARGHLRAIAAVLGVDPAPLLRALEQEGPQEPPPLPLAADRTAPQRQRRRPSWSAAAALALVAVAAIAAVQLVGGPAGPDGPAGSGRRGTAATPAPTVSPSATPPSSTAAPSRRPGVTVLVRATGRSWVSVQSADGRALYAGVLDTGQSRLFRDGVELRVVVGYAPAVELVVNGVDIGSPPAQGNVARLVFGPQDPGQVQAEAGG